MVVRVTSLASALIIFIVYTDLSSFAYLFIILSVQLDIQLLNIPNHLIHFVVLEPLQFLH